MLQTTRSNLRYRLVSDLLCAVWAASVDRLSDVHDCTLAHAILHVRTVSAPTSDSQVISMATVFDLSCGSASASASATGICCACCVRACVQDLLRGIMEAALLRRNESNGRERTTCGSSIEIAVPTCSGRDAFQQPCEHATQCMIGPHRQAESAS